MNITNKLPMQSCQHTDRFPTKLTTKLNEMERK